MTTLFAIDTAADRCKLALSRDSQLALLSGPPGHTHIEHVLPLIDQLFAQCDIGPEQCDAFAFASGPGAFTGLRVACTIAQGLALGTGRPVIAIGNLLALASACEALQPPDAVARRAFVAIDARMQQAYWAVYEGAGTDWVELAAPALCNVNAMGELIDRWQADFCGGDANWLERSLGACSVPLCHALVDGGALARLAAARFAAGAVLPARAALPAYVRDEVARTVAQRRQDARGPSA